MKLAIEAHVYDRCSHCRGRSQRGGLWNPCVQSQIFSVKKVPKKFGGHRNPGRRAGKGSAVPLSSNATEEEPMNQRFRRRRHYAAEAEEQEGGARDQADTSQHRRPQHEPSALVLNCCETTVRRMLNDGSAPEAGTAKRW